MSEKRIIISGIGDLVTSIPAMLSYVPDNHVVFIVHSTSATEGDKKIGPLVCVEITDELSSAASQALAAVIADARHYGKEIVQVQPVVITDVLQRRVQAIDLVEGKLASQPILPVFGAVYLHALTPGAAITGWDEHGGFNARVGDWAATQVAAQAAYEGRRIRQSQQRWREEGGQQEREDQMRHYRESMGDQQDQAD